ncbi:hypothetical protein B296_00045472 [Ensete ventricosum]|uniref:cytokinin riboside 5'-monophosphate phosphoribohydrolase n=1 Tax=Ensete ventricosum TaxID=4639 RepID=A0A426XKR0_ENSVE|nr:hypothetical protein B296_00045472 [Ensete ventricosum]
MRSEERVQKSMLAAAKELAAAEENAWEVMVATAGAISSDRSMTVVKKRLKKRAVTEICRLTAGSSICGFQGIYSNEEEEDNSARCVLPRDGLQIGMTALDPVLLAFVERKIDLVYGGGSAGLMGLVSKTVFNGGCHVLGYNLTASANMCSCQVGLLNVDGYYDSLLALFDKGVEQGFIEDSARHIVASAESAEELLRKMEVGGRRGEERRGWREHRDRRSGFCCVCILLQFWLGAAALLGWVGSGEQSRE